MIRFLFGTGSFILRLSCIWFPITSAYKCSHWGFFIVVCSEKAMNTCLLWHSNFCCSNIVVIVGVSFASTVCPIQYTVDLTSVCRKFVMSVIHYLFETLPHTSALNRHIHQTNFLMWRWRFITVLQKVISLQFCIKYIYIYMYVLSILSYH